MGARKDRKNHQSEIPFRYWCDVTSDSTNDNAIYLSTGTSVFIRQSRTTNDDLITTSECISADTLTPEN